MSFDNTDRPKFGPKQITSLSQLKRGMIVKIRMVSWSNKYSLGVVLRGEYTNEHGETVFDLYTEEFSYISISKQNLPTDWSITPYTDADKVVWEKHHHMLDTGLILSEKDVLAIENDQSTISPGIPNLPSELIQFSHNRDLWSRYLRGVS